MIAQVSFELSKILHFQIKLFRIKYLQNHYYYNIIIGFILGSCLVINIRSYARVVTDQFAYVFGILLY
ncbi:unnamed protein product [Paramecium primaurelia]|uniref:Uncharacterized protein n=1 Tax=Paramecium primaurelia TaxID=5886 RepID=A0A8S1QCX0_PARPR|nr:unnamed protein product [Paramecium primaurelia]